MSDSYFNCAIKMSEQELKELVLGELSKRIKVGEPRSIDGKLVVDVDSQQLKDWLDGFQFAINLLGPINDPI